MLGGAGLGFSDGEAISAEFSQQGVHISAADGTAAELALPEVAELLISGPGTVVKGGGFVGGGFGVAGALEGIGLAAVLNALTTSKTIHSFVTLVTNVGELHLHYAGLEPGALRMVLAPFFVAMRRISLTWVDERLAMLRRLLEGGHLDEAEFNRLAGRLREGRIARTGERLGRCPACAERIPLTSEECPKCTANFGAGSAWKVLASD